MSNTFLINMSPRGQKSNSYNYLNILKGFLEEENIKCALETFSRKHYLEGAEKLLNYEKVVLAFPLYGDCFPSTLLEFFNILEELNKVKNKKVKVYGLINCGFLEAKQMKVSEVLFSNICNVLGMDYQCSLEIASGEAILTTMFKSMALRAVKKMAYNIKNNRNKTISVQMPLKYCKKIFINESDKFWVENGFKNGLTRELMEQNNL